MSPGVLLSAAAAIFVAMMLASLILLHMMAQQERRQARMIAMQRSAGLAVAAETTVEGSASWLQMVASMGRVLARSGLLPASTVNDLQQTLATAGFRQSNALGVFLGAKLLLLLLLPAITYVAVQQLSLAPPLRVLLIGAGAVGGMLAPDMLIRRLRQGHLQGVERGLPDALDMLVICTEAGLGLETGFDRVASEIAPAHPAVALELQMTATELRILSDRRIALNNMGGRTGLPVMQRLGGTLIQTMQYGTPLSQALRTLASEMRYEMQMRFEARAARLPVLLTMPMILFILPCIFIVVGGPAGLTVSRTVMHHNK